MGVTLPVSPDVGALQSGDRGPGPLCGPQGLWCRSTPARGRAGLCVAQAGFPESSACPAGSWGSGGQCPGRAGEEQGGQEGAGTDCGRWGQRQTVFPARCARGLLSPEASLSLGHL